MELLVVAVTRSYPRGDIMQRPAAAGPAEDADPADGADAADDATAKALVEAMGGEVLIPRRLVLAALREHFELRRALAAWRGGQGQRVLDGTLALPCDQLLVLYTECAQLANVASGAQVSKLDHARVAE